MNNEWDSIDASTLGYFGRPTPSGCRPPSSDAAFYRRFAGRVETGRHSVSDPAFGMPDL